MHLCRDTRRHKKARKNVSGEMKERRQDTVKELTLAALRAFARAS